MENQGSNRDPQREQLLSALNDNSVAAIFVKDRMGVYRLVNRGCEVIWRLPRGEILGRTDEDLLPAECAQTLREHDRRVMDHGQPLDFEERLDVPGGAFVFMVSKAPLRDASGSVIGICGVAIDVTDFKRVEASLRESEQRFRTLADSLPMLVWLSGKENEGVWFNRTWLEFTGRSMKDEVGDGWLKSMHPDDRAEAFSHCEKAFRERRPFSMNFRMRRADGRYRWMLDSGTPRFGADGGFEGFVGSCVDITERQETESKLREQAAALVAADRRKDEFLAMLAHELRNPLAPILLAAESLTEIDDPRVAEPATTICRQVAQMRRLVDDLLDVARITRNKIRLKSEPVAVSDFLRVAIDTTRPALLERYHELVFDPPAGDQMVMGDPERLSQVFANLLHNAAKFTPKGGRVELATSEHDGFVEIVVRDNGRGIASADLPHVFDLFHQTETTIDRAEGGLGIGLTLVKRLVEMHGGSVSVSSRGSGTGSEFTVRLPRSSGSTAAPADDRTRKAPGSTPKALRVLVVDDNRAVAGVLARMLAARGHTVETSHDGRDALEAAERFRPDVVILDIGLPGLDGFEVANSLRGGRAAGREGPSPFLVAMSGYGPQGRPSERIFDVWLMKPVSRDRIDRVLADFAEAAGKASGGKGADPT